MNWDVLKNAIARVMASGDDGVIGTAFFVGGVSALTALHVVADTRKNPPQFAENIVLKFPDGHSTGATVDVGLWDSAADWAVLQCAKPPNVPAIEMRSTLAQDDEWKAFGYPEIHPEGKTIGGKVRDAAATYASAQAIELFCDEGAAGHGARLHGFSGAPCIVDGQAAGVLRATLVEESVDGRRERKLFTQAGTVYACPTKAIMDFQIAKGMFRLSGTWRPPEIVQQEFLVLLSSSEGRYRRLESVAKKAHEKLTSLVGAPFVVPFADVFRSRDAFLACVSALCRAKVVVLDATGFEPASMLLAGIRSVVRRSITILSVGHDYALGDPLDVPFNVTDANIVSHSGNQAGRGPDPVDLLASRVRRGLQELSMSSYLDNPVYESIRRLPSDRRGLIPKKDGVLVLCPFQQPYNSEIWERRLRRGLKHQLDRLRGEEVPKPDDLGVARSFELNSPRLVTQALYEHIRRAQACVADLTHWSESVLFEIGVRLAATSEGTSCLLAKDCKPKFPEYEEQCEQIASLFVDEEGIYDPMANWEEEEAYARAYGPDAVLPFRGMGDGSVHRAIAAALDVDTEPASRSVYRELIDSAELFGKVRGNSKPVGLYPSNALLTAREEVAEFDRLLMAWLHLYYRHAESERAQDPHLRKAIEQISVPLMERHVGRIKEMQNGASDDLKNVLSALIDAFDSI